MNDSRASILLIYPYANIDTNPTMAFLLESLGRRKVQVDVLVEENGRFPAPDSFGDSIHLKALPWAFFQNYRAFFRGLPKRLGLKVLSPGRYPDYSLRFDPAIFALFEAKRYSLIVGVDPPGIVLADRLNRYAKKPLVYVSFEIMFGEEVTLDEEQALKRMERDACERTSLVLIQDDDRAEVFCRETSFPREKVLMVPVAPPPQEVAKSDYLRKALGIPSSKRIVLFCGSLQSWSSRDELAEMVSYWSDNYCLVIHSRSKFHARMARYLKQLSQTGKIYVSSEPVGREEMSSLIASADFGLASYKSVPDSWYTGDNLYHLGFSSGKVSFYAMCGLPILARSLPVFEREFASYKCGKVYQRVAETGEMLEEMDRNYRDYSDEARRFYRERLDPVAEMEEFCNHLVALAGGGDFRIEKWSRVSSKLS